MPDDERPKQLLGWITIAAGILFVVTVVLVVMVQTIGPIFGFLVGQPSDGVIGSMLVFALIAFGLLPATAWFRRNGK